MFQTLQAIFDALDFGFQQVVEIVKALVHRLPEIIEARRHCIAQVVDSTIEVRDASALKINPEQVTAEDNSDRSPLINVRVHY